MTSQSVRHARGRIGYMTVDGATRRRGDAETGRRGDKENAGTGDAGTRDSVRGTRDGVPEMQNVPTSLPLRVSVSRLHLKAVTPRLAAVS